MEVAVSSNFPNKLKLVFVFVWGLLNVMGEVKKLSLCAEEFHIEVGALG